MQLAQAQSIQEPAPMEAKQAAQAGMAPVAQTVAHAATAAAQAIFLPKPHPCGVTPGGTVGCDCLWYLSAAIIFGSFI